jgi:hypothetical protein
MFRVEEAEHDTTVKAGGNAYSSALKVRCYFAPKRRLTFNRLYGVISQKIVLFITTAVRTSNPTTAAYSEDHTKHRKHFCGSNTELSNVIEGGTYIKFTYHHGVPGMITGHALFAVDKVALGQIFP